MNKLSVARPKNSRNFTTYLCAEQRDRERYLWTGPHYCTLKKKTHIIYLCCILALARNIRINAVCTFLPDVQIK
jgi:hypothetical protein